MPATKTKVYSYIWRLDNGYGPTLLVYRKCHSHNTPGNTWVEPLAGNCTTSSTQEYQKYIKVNHRGNVTLLFSQSKIYVGQSNIKPSSPISKGRDTRRNQSHEISCRKVLAQWLALSHDETCYARLCLHTGVHVYNNSCHACKHSTDEANDK